MNDILTELAEGVKGYTMEHEDALYIPVVVAKHPGNGDVARYLDSLPKDKTIKFPTVLHPQLRDMLSRRGYKVTHEWAEEFQEYAEVFVREGSRGAK